MRGWRTATLADLFITASEWMPQDIPGSLSPEMYADILSFILKANGMPGRGYRPAAYARDAAEDPDYRRTARRLDEAPQRSERFTVQAPQATQLPIAPRSAAAGPAARSPAPVRPALPVRPVWRCRSSAIPDPPCCPMIPRASAPTMNSTARKSDAGVYAACERRAQPAANEELRSAPRGVPGHRPARDSARRRAALRHPHRVSATKCSQRVGSWPTTRRGDDRWTCS